MKLARIPLQGCALAILVLSVPAMAQDADQQKLTEIETELAAQATPSGSGQLHEEVSL